MFGDSGSANHAEHSVLVKPNKKTRLMKLALVLGAVALFVGVFVVLSIIGLGGLLLPSSVMIIVVEVFFVWYFWKYTNIEYDYLIATGDLSVTAVYGGRTRKEIFSVKISTASVIDSYSGSPSKEEAEADVVYRCVSSFESNDILYIVFKNQEGKNCVAYFEASKKMIKLLRFYNGSACRVSAV